MIALPDLEIIRPLGQGSFANVFLAREPELKRLVAIKMLRDELAADEHARLRFEREAQAAASISHPNVTAVYRVGRRADGVPFIVMEYVDGRTLADLLAAHGPLTIDHVKRVAISIANALGAAHRKNIVHRDVRPANVMWENESDRIVLMDFGIAALLESGAATISRLTRTGEFIGDPLHMSPEQVHGEPVTPQSDVYQLGVTAYELLTGRVAREPLPLRDIRREVPAEFSDVVQRCLAANPQHRPRAAEVAETLLKESVSVPAAGIPAAESSSPVQHFFRELGRRKVYRVAVAYIAGAAIILQGAQLVLPGLPIANSNRWYSVLLVTLIAGFPLALVLSWIYDWTSTGIKRTRRRS